MHKLPQTGLASILLCCMGAVQAGGITITEVSASGLGTAYASGGAAAEDASSLWFNPASMTLLDQSLTLTGSLVAPQFDYRDRGSVQQLGPGMSVPLLPGADPRDPGGEASFVPAVFYSRPLGERLRIGIGVNAPFGLATEYSDDWRGRYQAVRSEIVDINVNPSIAWQATEEWSLGAGVSINYLDAELTNAVDFAAVCAAAAGGACPNGAVPGQGQFDGFVSNEADDVSYGVNVGALWQLADTRVSVAYRSQIEHELNGTADYRAPQTLGGVEALGPALGAALQARFSDTDISADLTLPGSASIGLAQALGRWTAVADLTWFDWSDVPEVRIEQDNPAADDLVEPLGWEDSVRAAAGLIGALNRRWTVRFGAAFDESPVPGPELRSARVPDSDRWWLAAGASYHRSPAWSIDFGYAHLFAEDPDIRRSRLAGSTFIGEFDSAADIVSVQLTMSL